ncbi:hypothetical protein ABLG96_05465 [Nakamurella sp. A5-74]|uniref:Uncharacterized protein n=1 Tax=Nakamurella sp. A5-74 TaxID=3158264 RepID=A0AAU8DSE1_9ACTN
MRIVPRALFGAISALIIATGSVVVTAGSASAAPAKLSQSQASSQLGAAGIRVTSSGGCTTRSNSSCTSLSQVNAATIQGAVTLKNASGCALTVTGGTEVGHASGTYSHYNGYKLDFAITSCLTNYITGNFTSIGGSKWKAGSGNIYYSESNHWDVTFYSCGC